MQRWLVVLTGVALGWLGCLTVAQAQDVVEVKPQAHGYQVKAKQHIPPGGANRFGLAAPYPQYDGSRFDGIVGFTRSHAGRAYQVYAYRTGLFFGLDAVAPDRVVRKASLRFSMIDVREPGARIRDGGQRCLSVVKDVRMLSPQGVALWAEGNVDKFAATKAVGVSVPNVVGSTVTVDVTRFWQNAHANADDFSGRLGLALVGHREDFGRVRKDRQCMAMLGASTLVLELAPR